LFCTHTFSKVLKTCIYNENYEKEGKKGNTKLVAIDRKKKGRFFDYNSKYYGDIFQNLKGKL